MPQFSVKPTRLDPYKNCKFRSKVLTDADFTEDWPFGKYWEDYLSHLQLLAGLFLSGSLSELGLAGQP